MSKSTLPRPKKTDPLKYGETKKRYQIMLTETASDIIDEISDQLKITRSEVLERLVRTECCNAKNLKDGY